MVAFEGFRAFFALQVFGAHLEPENPAFLRLVDLESRGVGRLERFVVHRLFPFAKNVFLLPGWTSVVDVRE